MRVMITGATGFIGRFLTQHWASQDLPVREDHSLRPLHPYGVSKVAQDLLAPQYFADHSIPAIRIRIFNTTGPGKIADACSDLTTMRVIEVELGMHPAFLRVGNLANRRAIADVRDLVRGLWLSAERCEAGEVYNRSRSSTRFPPTAFNTAKLSTKVASS